MKAKMKELNKLFEEITTGTLFDFDQTKVVISQDRKSGKVLGRLRLATKKGEVFVVSSKKPLFTFRLNVPQAEEAVQREIDLYHEDLLRQVEEDFADSMLRPFWDTLQIVRAVIPKMVYTGFHLNDSVEHYLLADLMVQTDESWSTAGVDDFSAEGLTVDVKVEFHPEVQRAFLEASNSPTKDERIFYTN